MQTLERGLLNFGDDLSPWFAEDAAVVMLEDPPERGRAMVVVALEPNLLGTALGRLLTVLGWIVSYDPVDAGPADHVRAVMTHPTWPRPWPDLAQEVTVLIPRDRELPARAATGRDTLGGILTRIGRPAGSGHVPSAAK